MFVEHFQSMDRQMSPKTELFTKSEHGAVFLTIILFNQDRPQSMPIKNAKGVQL